MFFRKKIDISKHIESETEERRRKCIENWEEIVKSKAVYNRRTGRIEVRS